MKEVVQFIDTRFFVEILLLLVGFILGSWFEIWRDKRKEFNEIADVVNQTLNRELESLKTANGVTKGPSDADFEKLRRRLYWFNRRGFEKVLKNYQANKSSENWDYNELNEPYYKDTEKIISSINTLLSYTKRR